MIFIDSKLIVPGDDAATFNNIMANELRFRIGAAYELVMFASVVILALALYVILKTVNKDLAMLGLFWRLGEAILGGVVALNGLVVLLLLKGEGFSAAFETGQLQTLVGLFLNVRSAALTIVIVFLSLGTIIFCYLFFKSRYVPRILAGFGIFSFSLMFIYSFVNILFPAYAATIEIVAYTPGTLFEIIFGLWLLVKGVKIPEAKS